MSEYWKSTPKYWCKHCSAYVKDTPFERKQHESTAKHQGNLKRFLRGIQSDHEREERDKTKVKVEVERLNRVVGGSSTVAASTSSLSSAKPTFTKNKSSNISAEDQKRQWAQLAEMGIKVPGGAQKEVAIAGDWKTIATTSPYENAQDDPLSIGIRKRKFEDADEEEEGKSHNAHKGWGSKTKRYPGAEENNDLDDLLNGPALKKDTSLKTEVKPEIPSDSGTSSVIDPATKVKAENSVKQYSGDSRPNTGLDVQQQWTEVEPKLEVKDDDFPLLAASGQAESAPVFKKRKPKSKNNLAEVSGAT